MREGESEKEKITGGGGGGAMQQKNGCLCIRWHH